MGDDKAYGNGQFTYCALDSKYGSCNPKRLQEQTEITSLPFDHSICSKVFDKVYPTRIIQMQLLTMLLPGAPIEEIFKSLFRIDNIEQIALTIWNIWFFFIYPKYLLPLDLKRKIIHIMSDITFECSPIDCFFEYPLHMVYSLLFILPLLKKDHINVYKLLETKRDDPWIPLIKDLLSDKKGVSNRIWIKKNLLSLSTFAKLKKHIVEFAPQTSSIINICQLNTVSQSDLSVFQRLIDYRENSEKEPLKIYLTRIHRMFKDLFLTVLGQGNWQVIWILDSYILGSLHTMNNMDVLATLHNALNDTIKELSIESVALLFKLDFMSLSLLQIDTLLRFSLIRGNKYPITPPQIKILQKRAQDEMKSGCFVTKICAHRVLEALQKPTISLPLAIRLYNKSYMNKKGTKGFRFPIFDMNGVKYIVGDPL
jgi:hypothetical protein